MRYQSRSLVVISHSEDWGRGGGGAGSKSWVLCFHVEEKAEGRDFCIISISGKFNDFKTWQILRNSTFLLVNQDTAIGTRVGKRPEKGPIQLRLFWMVMLKRPCLLVPLCFLHAYMRSDITGITDKGAWEENECHLLGIKPDFQSLEQLLLP